MPAPSRPANHPLYLSGSHNLLNKQRTKQNFSFGTTRTYQPFTCSKMLGLLLCRLGWPLGQNCAPGCLHRNENSQHGPPLKWLRKTEGRQAKQIFSRNLSGPSFPSWGLTRTCGKWLAYPKLRPNRLTWRKEESLVSLGSDSWRFLLNWPETGSLDFLNCSPG